MNDKIYPNVHTSRSHTKLIFRLSVYAYTTDGNQKTIKRFSILLIVSFYLDLIAKIRVSVGESFFLIFFTPKQEIAEG